MRRVFRIPFSRQRIAREVDDELSFHFEMRIQRLVAAGWTYDAARQEALRQFGDVAPIRDSMVTMDLQRENAMRRANLWSEVQQDIVYAMRTLRRNIGFTAVIVGALAIGIGANTAIFTLIDAVLVRALPVDHPEQLVAVGHPARVGSMSMGSPRVDLLSYPVYKDVRERNQVFTGLLASGRADRLDVRIDSTAGEFEHPRGRLVSGNYFTVLGVRPALGRAFDADMDRVNGAAPVIVISHGYWTRRFHNEPAVVGRTILVNGIRMAILGIAPESFTGEIVGSSPDMWLPISMNDALTPNRRILDDRGTSWLLLLGRLKPGATVDQAYNQVSALIERSIVSNATPAVAKSFNGRPRTHYIASGARGFSRVRDTFKAPLFTLMIGVALLLCIICANVANLLLARAIARGREMAVRLALGAARGRLVRQLMTESFVLASLAAGIGLLVAWWGSRALLTLAADGGRIPLDLGLDVPVLIFTLVVSVLAVALFGLAPALRASRVDLASSMRSNSSAVSGDALAGRGQRAPLGKLLIAGQVALSVVLLVGATMLVRSLRNLQTVEVGLDRDHLVIVDVDASSRGYTGDALRSLARRMTAQLAAVPGVKAVSLSENGIFSGTESGTVVQVPGFIARTPDDSLIAYDQVGPGYINAIGARLLTGRDVSTIDDDKLPRVAVVNQALASFYFPGKDAVGQYLRFSDSVAVQIVGVVANVRDHSLTEKPERRAYFPYMHSKDSANFGEPGGMRLIVRTVGDPSALVQTIRRAVISVDPQLPIDGVDPLKNLMRATIREERLVAKLATAFGTLALLLAAIGLYGVMTYAITRRTSEIGLRVALGAQRSDVIRMVLVDALRLVGVGVVVGLPIAVASTRYLKTQLHDVTSVDPVSLTVAVSVLIVSAVIAVTLPAMRASRVSPIVALKGD